MIDATATKFEVSIPARFVQTSNVKNIKFQKIKDLELLLAQRGRLNFKAGEYVNALFEELQRIDGTRSSSKKDDRADSLAQVASVYKIYSIESNSAQPEDANEVERMERKAALLAETKRYFGGTNYKPPLKPVGPATPQPPPTRFPNGAGRFASLPASFRGMPTKR